MSNMTINLMRIKRFLSPESFTNIGKYSFIFIVALSLRCVHFYQIYKTPLLSPDYVPDTLAFIVIAQKIIEGNFFYAIPMNMNILYSIYLVPFILFFQESLLAAVFFQLIIDALSALIVFRIANKIFDIRSAFLAGFIYAVYGPLIWYAGAPLGESLSIFFLLLSFNLLITALDSKTHPVYYYISGFMLAVASLGRPNIIILSILVILVMLFYDNHGKKRLQTSARFTLGILFVLIPFSLNNYYIEKSWSPYPAKGGINFYAGNHIGAKGIYELIPGISNMPYIYMYEAQDVASKNMGKELNVKEADAYWYREGLSFIALHSMEALKLWGVKALLFMNNKELATNMDYDFCKEFSSILKYSIIPPGVLIALAIMGMLIIPNNDPKAILLKIFLAGLIISTITFYVSERLRIVSFPFIILLSSQYLFIIYDFFRKREKPKLFVATISMIALILVSAIPLAAFDINTQKTTSYAYYQYGIYLLNSNKQNEAILEFKKAIELNSADPEPYYQLSLIYYTQRQYLPALQYLNRAKLSGLKIDSAYEKKLLKLAAPK
jgi:4-amino-4-deoxy-L-arabinose transferase-like glycosyltransferase